MITTKSRDVRLKVLSPALAYIFYKLEEFHRTFGPIDNLVITSINDGAHGPGSRHYTDEAIDIRSKNFPSEAVKREFRMELEAYLGPKFRVLYESAGLDNQHFHVQVRKGMRFP